MQICNGNAPRNRFRAISGQWEVWLLHVWDSNVKNIQLQEKVCEPSSLLMYYSKKLLRQNPRVHTYSSNCIYIHLAWCYPMRFLRCVWYVCVPFSSCPLVSGVPWRGSSSGASGKMTAVSPCWSISSTKASLLLSSSSDTHSSFTATHTNTHLHWCSTLCLWTEYQSYDTAQCTIKIWRMSNLNETK